MPGSGPMSRLAFNVVERAMDGHTVALPTHRNDKLTASILEAVFLWLCASKGKTLDRAVADLPVDLGAPATARAAFAHSGAYRGDTAVARHGRFCELLDTSSLVALARSVLLLHEKVSAERRRAPWVWEDQGVLFSDVDVERPDDVTLRVGLAWRNDHYLAPLQGIAKQLAEVRQ